MNNNTHTTNHNTDLRRRVVGIVGITAASLAIGATLVGCSEEEGSGDIATLTMTDVVEPEITAVTVLDDFDVRVTVDPDASQSASLTIDDNLINNTDFWIDDGRLFVGWDDAVIGVEPTERPVLTLTVREFESVENLSDADVVVTGVDTYDFDVRSRRDGRVAVDGHATTVDVHATDESAVDLAELTAERVELVATGNGSLSVNATEKLTGEITADGDVTVYGGPDTSQVDASGSGELVMV